MHQYQLNQIKEKIRNLKNQINTTNHLNQYDSNHNFQKYIRKKIQQIEALQRHIKNKSYIQEEIQLHKLKIRLEKLNNPILYERPRSTSRQPYQFQPFREYFSIKTIKNKYENSKKYIENTANMTGRKISASLAKSQKLNNRMSEIYRQVPVQKQNNIKYQYNQLLKVTKKLQKQYKQRQFSIARELNLLQQLKKQNQQLRQIIDNQTIQMQVLQIQNPPKEPTERTYKIKNKESNDSNSQYLRKIQSSNVTQNNKKNERSTTYLNQNNKKYDAQKQSINKLIQKNQQLEEKIEKLISENNSLKQKIKEIQLENKILANSSQQDKKLNHELKQQLKQIKRDLSQYLINYLKIDPQLTNLINRLQQCQQQNKQLLNNVLALHQENDQLKKQKKKTNKMVQEIKTQSEYRKGKDNSTNETDSKYNKQSYHTFINDKNELKNIKESYQMPILYSKK